MNILLTGGTGYVGSHCAVALLQAGYQVTLLDNLSNSDLSVVARIAQLAQGGSGSNTRLPQFIEGDIRNEALLDEVLAQGDFSAVLHCAGLKAVGDSWQQPLDYYQHNVAGSLLLAALMQKHRVPCLLFSSSATVYAASEQALDEQSPCAPASPYGRSKYFVESILADLCQANPSVSVILLRYFNPAGAHHSGLLGESPTGTPNNLLPFVAQVASGERSEIQIFANDYPTADGTGVRDYIHVEDVAKGHLLALQHHLTDPGLHLYNLGRGQGYSVLEVIRAFERSCGRSLPYRVVARRQGDVASTVACVAKARAQLGFVAERDLQQMTDDAWRWQQRDRHSHQPHKAGGVDE
ncbi:UDP-glucose 4-epimerase GalE [Rheinheimera sp. 4Y26]|uniref:UDP-glucose 4-epimerase GalE n=1 Tax=Rheinheimera sp. 4Y26 TaxID=2977811 RepID=UPI0021B11649|nr:UDP-glucose 4-epimerase GalE [Rheinheimera sp. 4Y26]MCT6698627.1 UDP-glucose 4-epimerase GalE [Rheinheimera sp. 4Y26]